MLAMRSTGIVMSVAVTGTTTRHNCHRCIIGSVDSVLVQKQPTERRRLSAFALEVMLLFLTLLLVCVFCNGKAKMMREGLWPFAEVRVAVDWEPQVFALIRNPSSVPQVRVCTVP